MAEDEGFFSRWSRRKVQARSGAPLAEPAPTGPHPVAEVPAEPPVPAAPVAAEPAAPAEPPAPAPTLEDVQRLTPDADFRAFVRPEVAPEVRNAAFRKLFSDPHFNVMDGLDIYIDDYSKPDPLPLAMARQMVAAQFMKVFDAPEQAAPAAEPAGRPAPSPDDAPAVADAVPPESAGADTPDAADPAATPEPPPTPT